MDPADLAGLRALLGLLGEATLAGSAAVLVVLALRRPLRNAFGAAVAYAAWVLVPAAVVAVALPAATVTVTTAPVAMLVSATLAPLAAMPVAAPFDLAPWLLAAWLAGALVMALRMGRQQRAFRRGLGRLRARADGLQQAETVAGLPAAMGVLRPAIVVPVDFDSRYSREERELMHAHERSHIVHGDLQFNALVALLRSVFWFNPLLNHAVRHFRLDQELACDQRVIARHPHGRRAYGEAMVKTQLASQPLPLGCHWAAFEPASSHPLTERIAMLKQPFPTAARWIGGTVLVFALTLGVGFAAWSAQPKREVPATDQLPPLPPAPPAAMSETDAMAPLPAPPAPPAPVNARAQHALAPAPLPPPAPPAPPTLRAPPAPPAPAIPPTPAAGIAPAAPQARWTPQPRAAPQPAARPHAPAAPRPPLTNTAPHARPAPSPAATRHWTPAPRYPEGVAAQGVGGNVVLLIDVDAQGKPVEIEIESAEPAGVFDAVAIDAARQWQFTPDTVDGKPAAGRVRVPLEFAAKQPATAPAL